ncbi:Uncharacterised protein [Yersinia enterocolitica]|nr:Uncharacterised protein [Yersinia enterocolitica]
MLGYCTVMDAQETAFVGINSPFDCGSLGENGGTAI